MQWLFKFCLYFVQDNSEILQMLATFAISASPLSWKKESPAAAEKGGRRKKKGEDIEVEKQRWGNGANLVNAGRAGDNLENLAP
jgi:hypothetical protein